MKTTVETVVAVGGLEIVNGHVCYARAEMARLVRAERAEKSRRDRMVSERAAAAGLSVEAYVAGEDIFAALGY